LKLTKILFPPPKKKKKIQYFRQYHVTKTSDFFRK
jgi:hypothetical protein